MLGYLARRLAFSLLSLAVVSLLVLSLLSLAPGDAATMMIGETASLDEMAALRQELRLDRPVTSQWTAFWQGIVLEGNLGRSLYTGRPVVQEIAERAPYTLVLALTAMSISLLMGVGLGLLAALRQGTWADVTMMAGTTLALAVPRFWLALLLLMLFSLHLGWLPVVGASSPRHMILPAVCLGMPTAAIFARLTRANVLDVLHSEHVVVARAKGLPEQAVIWRHLLRNSLIPTVTVAGLHFGNLLGGAFIIETIFGWPGLGRLAVKAVFERDWPIILGTTLAVALVYLLCNLIVDLMYGWLDPRVGRQSI